MRKTSLPTILMLCLCLMWGTGCTVKVGEDPADQPAQTDEAVSPAEQLADQDPLAGIDAASRVVALSRSTGELWLLAGGQLAGVTNDGLDLAGVSEDTRSVGSASDPDVQQVLALKPDLVILPEGEEAVAEARDALAQQQIPVLAVDVRTFDDYAQVMQALTQTTGRADLYEQNVADVQTQIDRVVENTSHTEASTYLALLISPTESTALASGHVACDMLDRLGLVNVAQDGLASDEVTVAAIAEADPAYVFVIYQGDDEAARTAFEETFVADDAWGSLTAEQTGHVVMLPQRLFGSVPNAKWGEAYAYLSQALHGSWA